LVSKSFASKASSTPEISSLRASSLAKSAILRLMVYIALVDSLLFLAGDFPGGLIGEVGVWLPL